MVPFQKINNITGWAVFAVAMIVYTLTLELTASFWDCGEFIAVSYKLMVPHPPGAPFFLLTGRLFSFLALGDVERVAFWINMLSVLSSGFTILFMFWTVVLLGRKIMGVELGKETRYQTFVLMGAGAAAALAYTFSDSFWFSAVEAEVYAMSSFFTAFVVWAMLKWDLIEDERDENRWLILIAYMVGLSIGVHLLNLVTLPALGLIYYYKKAKNPSWWGVFGALIVSTLIVLIINNGVIPGLPTIAGSFEIFFVNSIGLPFGSGIVVFLLLFIGALVYGIVWSEKQDKALINTALLCFSFILIGYSSYALVVIRSSYDPPIDENDPEDIMSVVSYLKREQYGSRPLLYGPYFTAEVVDQKVGSAVYVKGEEEYEISDYKIEYVYSPDQMTIIPRAWSSSSNHPQRYREILGLQPGQVPTFTDNLVFLFKHQIGHMYLRYFMWNFAGRQSDIQDAGWLSPVLAVKNAPESITSNRGRNNYFMIPLILGLIGLFYNYRKHPESFGFVFMLFILMGIALIFYLNSPPTEPRERDYIYAGSYYAFAFWIGFAVIGIASGIRRFVDNPKIAGAVAVALGMTAPIIMAAENWDDHDRSDRYFSVDTAKNFLASCAPNAILFTGGDNDTFPLWYAQEVEGFRTDVRVVVLSYANTDWYIEQMTRQAYESEPFPYTLSNQQYRQGGPNDVVFYQAMVDNPINLKQYIRLLSEDNLQLRRQTPYGGYNLVPNRTLFLDVDTARVREMDIIPETKQELLVPRMVFGMKGNVLEKKDVMILDLISTNDWERPIYFNNTSMQGINFDLTDYLIQEGQAFRLLPIKRPSNADFVDTETMYDNMMNNFYYRELNNPNSYYSKDYRGFAQNYRSSFNSLAEALIAEDKETRAAEVLNTSLEIIPDESVPFDISNAFSVDIFFQLGEVDTAKQIAETMAVRADEDLAYYIENDIHIGFEVQKNLGILQLLSRTMDRFGETDLAERYNSLMRNHYDALTIYQNR